MFLELSVACQWVCGSRKCGWNTDVQLVSRVQMNSPGVCAGQRQVWDEAWCCGIGRSLQGAGEPLLGSAAELVARLLGGERNL